MEEPLSDGPELLNELFKGFQRLEKALKGFKRLQKVFKRVLRRHELSMSTEIAPIREDEAEDCGLPKTPDHKGHKK